jgi:hypothetical protein
MTPLWGYIGHRDDGWKEEDEKKWDEVIDVMAKANDGGPLLKIVVNIPISTK